MPRQSYTDASTRTGISCKRLFTSMVPSVSGKRRRLVARTIAVAFAVLTSCPSAFALNPTLEVSQYAHSAWTVADGFTKGAIYAIAQTPDGYLWLGTEFGLLRFDGVRTTLWPSDRVFPSSQIRTLLTGRDGTLWVGTSKGLASWKDGRLTVYAELAGHIVTRTIQDRDGAVWVVGTTPPTGKLCAIRNGGVRCWGEDGRFGARVTEMYEDRKANLWFGEPRGVWRWNQGQPQFYPLRIDRSVQGLSEDSDGVLLVLLSGRIYRMMDGQVLEAYRLPDAIGRLTTRFVLRRDRDGGLWIGALGGGLAHIHNGTVDQFSESDGLSGNAVATLFQDREGNIWVGTQAGLDRFRELPVAPFTARQGFSNLRILAVVASTDSSVWVRTADGLNQWKDGRVNVYREFSDLSDSTALPHMSPATRDPADNGGQFESSGGALFEDERGRIWFSATRSVGYLDRGRFTAVRSIPGGRVHSITGNLMGHLWFAHETQGLFHLAGEHAVERISWARLGHTDYADTLAVDPSSDGLWLGFFRGGVEFVKDGQVRASYAEAGGLAPGRVNDLRFGRDGALWAAAEGGVSRLKSGRITTLSSRDGLPCSEAHWTMEDDAGDFWLSMPCGLVRIARTDLDAWTGLADEKRPQSRIPVTVLATADGVRSRANAGPFSPHVAKARDGRLWFFPLEGLSALDPHRLSFNTLPPPLAIEQISADSRIYLPASEVRLPPLIRNLAIDYTALSFVASEKVRFRTKLEGHDREWQNVGNRRQAFYTNLGPGRYRFRVTASNNSGVWNEAGASLDFAIAPAYYQTNLFRASVVAALLALLWSVYQLRLRQIAREYNARLDERVSERTRVARELHDTLLQTFHGLLFRFQAATNLLPEGPARQSFESAIDQAAQAITEGRDAVQGLRSSTVTTNDLPAAIGSLGDELSTNETNKSAVAFHVHVEGAPRNLHPIIRDDIYRIAGEAIRNAFRHAQARHIDADIEYHARQLRLLVRDDGQGIDPTVIEGSGRGHWGLPGMRERAELIGGHLEVWSQLGSGTEVRLTIPASRAYATSSGRRFWWSSSKTGTNA
jgi:signal transduction histidine kinase/ligand-binding sensor domain-containing protein